MDDAKRVTRVPCYTHVTIRGGGEVFYGMSGDISEGGIFIATFDRLPEEGEVRLSFTLPRDEPEPVEAEGRVVWMNSKQRPVGGYRPEGFGVEFTGMSAGQLSAIREFVTSAHP